MGDWPTTTSPMKKLSKVDQAVLRALSEGLSDYEVCRRLSLTMPALARSIKRIEARAATAEESENAAIYYERALKKRQERINVSLSARLHALMDASPQAVLVIDGRTGAIKEFNEVACTLFGYTKAELSELTVEDLVPKAIRAIHHAYRLGFLANVRKREMGYHPPILGVRKDGSEVDMAVALTATVADDDVMVVCTERVNWAGAPPLRSHAAEAL